MNRADNIRAKFESLWPMLKDEAVCDPAILLGLEELLDRVDKDISETYYRKKLETDWPDAADQSLICGSTEEDKKSRASAIYNLFFHNRLQPGFKFLDYGCGEGHLVERAVLDGANAVGYDIVGDWARWEGLTLTTDREKVTELGPYNLIAMYDVLDHVMDDPAAILKDAKTLLAPGGVIVVRFHPWSCRHGTHLWSLNKRYAHLVFSDAELEQMGHHGLPTYKVIYPRVTYQQWISAAGLRITWEKTVYEQSGPMFELNPLLKQRLLRHFPNGFGYHDIEETFKDYVLEV